MDRLEALELREAAPHAGDSKLTPSLTIVLPIHNGETRLRSCVGEILELASELTPNFSVLIVDDGSTDDTLSTAEELSARYPQITVRRHRQRRGLGPTLEVVRRRVQSDVVIVHDGVSHIDPNQIRTLWRQRWGQSSGPGFGGRSTQSAAGLLSDVAKGHTAVAAAHGRMLGFQIMSLESAVSMPAKVSETAVAKRPRTDLPHAVANGGIGQIPPLPRPKLLTALADFAFGE